jgi:hypothetical protein
VLVAGERDESCTEMHSLACSNSFTNISRDLSVHMGRVIIYDRGGEARTIAKFGEHAMLKCRWDGAEECSQG